MAERPPELKDYEGVEVLLVEDNEQDADLIVLAFKKDLPEVVGQTLPRSPQFRPVGDRTVDRQRPVDR